MNTILNNVRKYISENLNNNECDLNDYITNVNEAETWIQLHKSGLEGAPSIYVGTYAKYNGGDLTGMWVDVASFDDYEEFNVFIHALHGDEADPELMLQDYECYPRSMYDECGHDEDTFNRIKAYAEMCDEYDADAVEAYADEFPEDEDFSEFADRYAGEYETDYAFGYRMMEESGMLAELPEFAERYFDYEKFGYELLRDDYCEVDGYIFRRY